MWAQSDNLDCPVIAVASGSCPAGSMGQATSDWLHTWEPTAAIVCWLQTYEDNSELAAHVHGSIRHSGTVR